MLSEIEAYLTRTGMRETRFGRLVASDPRLVGDLRRGRRPGAEMTARVARFLVEHRA